MSVNSETKFISTISHKLKTPLNAILGFSELLLEQVYGTLNEKQIHYLKNIHSSGENLLTLLNDLMDLMNFRWGETQLNYSDFPLPLAINEACESVKNWVAKKNISLEIKNGEGVSVIRADEAKFMKILHHLLSNAIKFTQSGGEVKISTQFLKAPPDEGSPFSPRSTLRSRLQTRALGYNPKTKKRYFPNFIKLTLIVLRILRERDWVFV